MSVAAIAWVAVGAVFIGLRLAAALDTPVGGPELIHLSGAWTAHLGDEDSRFVPALPQAIAALTFFATDSELPIRLIVLVITATIPAALYLLRPHLGEAGALVALFIIALDPIGIALQATASGLALDSALVLWCAVLLARGRGARLYAGPAGFLAGACGPLTLPFVAAAAATAPRGAWARPSGSPLTDPRLHALGGFVVAVLVSSFRYGLGWDGLRVPPLLLFGDGFGGEWASATTAELLLLYTVPLAAGGAAAAVACLWRWRHAGSVSPAEWFLLAWAGVAALWLITSLRESNPAPILALNLPLALLLGPAIVRAVGACAAADWRLGRFLLPAAAVLGALALVPVLEWADRGVEGEDQSQLRVAIFSAAALAAVIAAAWTRRQRATAFAPALLLGFGGLLAGATGMAFRFADEPLPSPFSPQQARDLRDLSLELQAESGGPIVIHPRLREDATWPFRDSGDIVVASTPPLDAAVILWPPDLPPPEGFATLEGDWALIRRVVEPTSDWLDYLNWMLDRSTLTVRSEPILVFTGPAR
jgi:hypothetical protein